MQTDWALRVDEMKCMECGQVKPARDYTMVGTFKEVWRSRYCEGKCFERRYGNVIGKMKYDTLFDRFSGSIRPVAYSDSK